jgi:hypothetical protein
LTFRLFNEDCYKDLRKGTLREECVLFAKAHANQFDLLLTFLDELSDFSIYETVTIPILFIVLEPNILSISRKTVIKCIG